MKTIYVSFAAVCVAFVSCFGQNPNFRVDKIVHIGRLPNSNVVDTVTEKYEYANNLLTKVTFSTKKEVIDVHTYTYDNGNFSVKDKFDRALRSHTFDGSGKVKVYTEGSFDSYPITYTDGLITQINYDDGYEDYHLVYNYSYQDGKLSMESFYNKRNPDIKRKLSFTYDKNHIVSAKQEQYESKSYDVVYEGDLIKSIDFTDSYAPNNWKRYYKYDKNGNIIEETLVKKAGESEVVVDKYTITYLAGAANDKIVWDWYDWNLNILFKQRTYKKYQNIKM